MTEHFRNFISGSWIEPANGQYIENVNPACTSDIVGLFPDTDPSELDVAVESAQRGFEDCHGCRHRSVDWS